MGAVSLVFIFSPGLSCDATLRSEVMMRGRLFPHKLVCISTTLCIHHHALMDGCDPVWTHGLGRFLNQCRRYLLECCYPGAGAPEGAGKGDISKGGIGITSMAFGENNLALSITEGFTQCPGLPATLGLGHTVGEKMKVLRR